MAKITPALAMALNAQLLHVHAICPVNQVRDDQPGSSTKTARDIPVLKDAPVAWGYDLAKQNRKDPYGYSYSPEPVRVLDLLPGGRFRESCLRILKALSSAQLFHSVSDNFSDNVTAVDPDTADGPMWKQPGGAIGDPILVDNPAFRALDQD